MTFNEKSENIWQAYRVEPLHWIYSMNGRNELKFVPLWLIYISYLVKVNYISLFPSSHVGSWSQNYIFLWRNETLATDVLV